MPSSDFDSRDPRAPGLPKAVWAAGAAIAVLVGGGAFFAAVAQRPAKSASAELPAIAELIEQPAAIAAAPARQPNATIGTGAFGAIVWSGAPAPVVAAAAAPASAVRPLGPEIRVMPSPSAANSGSQIGAAVLSLATRWLASEDDRPPPVFFASDLVADRVAPPPLAVAYAQDLARPPRELNVALSKGETLVDALRRAGVRADDRNEAAYAFGKLYDLRTLRPGQSFDLTVAEPNKTLFELISLDEAPALYLIALDYNADRERRISLARTPEGRFSAKEQAAPLTTRIAAVRGRIDGSLYLSAKRQGAPDEVIAGLAQMFAYDVDFQREIFGGDEFEAIFEVRYDETGKLVAGGDVLYGRLHWRGRTREKGYYRLALEVGGRGDYFDPSGESARRLLMKTPIDGARLSSGFGTRRHPILGYAKAHKGVDFAAARGTPIMAAGDGVVEKAGPFGTFGNYIRIRHAQGYKTAYAHMNSIRKGVRAGARVRQGDVIGTVGSTGRSTGPHLHYEVHLKDRAVNPQSLKIATGYQLAGKDLARFRDVRDRIDQMRAQPAEPEPSLVAENAKNRSL